MPREGKGGGRPLGGARPRVGQEGQARPGKCKAAEQAHACFPHVGARGFVFGFQETAILINEGLRQGALQVLKAAVREHCLLESGMCFVDASCCCGDRREGSLCNDLLVKQARDLEQ